MAKNLVIVESPAKAKTINKYLGKDYLVKASIGHIKDLPTKGLGVDVDDDFKPTYEVIPDTRKRNNKKIVAELRAAAKAADTIYFAADPDREGEAICQHLAEEIVPKRPAKATFRVMFNEITKRAVNEAFEHPKQIDQNLVDSQQARRVLDRLVGYKVSPLLCRTVGGKLSAGRVQSVALRMVVEREREIEKFIKTEYWTVAANLAAKLPPAFEARLFKVGDQTVKTGGFELDLSTAAPSLKLKANEIVITNDEQAREIVAEANQQTFVVSEVTRKERKRNPVPPFITSKLQQEAARKLGWAVRRTMMVAQKLYEGIEIGAEGSVGLITYMRTDSTRVSDAALGETRDFISQQYGAPYLPEKAVHYRSKKGAQDAHEAIRPTDVARTPDSLASYLNADELRLYRLIWQRMVASQMTPAVFDQTTIDIGAGRFIFRATGSVQKFDGFLKVYQEGRDEKTEEDEEAERTLPPVEKDETLAVNQIKPEQHFTDPPPRFTEATLVKALEEKGIGRPSTYAAIMTTILAREYVEKLEGRFHPTELGKTVNDLLIQGGFGDLFNETYTARMEEELDSVEEGKLKWTDALHEFYGKFSSDLEKFKIFVKDIKDKDTPTDEVCLKCETPGMVLKWGRFGKYLKCLKCGASRDAEPKAGANGSAEGSESTPGSEEAVEPEACELCGKQMQLKRGRFGPFLGCTGYPECRNIRKIAKSGVAAPAPVPLDEKCPVDDAQLVRRFGRFGEFISCSNYPKCKYIKQESTGVPCARPGCKGDLVVKKSKRGKVFYGCGTYPDCDRVYWDKPVSEVCPKCSAPFLLEKTTKKQGTFQHCANEECGYSSIDPTGELAKAAPAKKTRKAS